MQVAATCLKPPDPCCSLACSAVATNNKESYEKIRPAGFIIFHLLPLLLLAAPPPTRTLCCHASPPSGHSPLCSPWHAQRSPGRSASSARVQSRRTKMMLGSPGLNSSTTAACFPTCCCPSHPSALQGPAHGTLAIRQPRPHFPPGKAAPAGGLPCAWRRRCPPLPAVHGRQRARRRARRPERRAPTPHRPLHAHTHQRAWAA